MKTKDPGTVMAVAEELEARAKLHCQARDSLPGGGRLDAWKREMSLRADECLAVAQMLRAHAADLGAQVLLDREKKGGAS